MTGVTGVLLGKKGAFYLEDFEVGDEDLLQVELGEVVYNSYRY
jgi:hypothetical protein